ncbi:unnamed protein product [Didymodactylos carnosus]|uniref:Uncharacterized protein n=1 Tax=Didymodactylos carnosus TaxID=1234261 RepID=A0A814RYS8_9BILA|nr:unnamed protein product [Didymodactylos carnosus]CAF1422929.1 unnamed protein product [Didymodactylos carnosus]CAF3902050.1 unnamed protein product [Didymodactylos carnosus]CAF4223188.1 unnamed protein product [Didymodactylos carnosus]
MRDIQTMKCLYEIPVIQSSTEQFQNVYTKAKASSRLIRLADWIALKSLSIAVTVATPLNRPVKVLDDFVARQIKQIETRYPIINTPTQQVVDKFNEKTEPVRQVVNRLKEAVTTLFNVQLYMGGKSTKVNDDDRSQREVQTKSKTKFVSSTETNGTDYQSLRVTVTTKNQATPDVQRLHSKVQSSNSELIYPQIDQSIIEPEEVAPHHHQQFDTPKSYDVRMLHSNLQAAEQREIWQNFRKQDDETEEQQDTTGPHYPQLNIDSL